MVIKSNNKISKLIKSLTIKKYRIDTGLFVVEGQRFVSEIPNWVEIAFYALSEDFDVSRIESALRSNIEKYIFSKDIFCSFSDTTTPQGIIAVCKLLNYDVSIISSSPDDVSTVLILEELRDPGNLGTLIRTADAAGIEAVFITENSVDLYNPKVLRSTMGSIFNLPVITGLKSERVIQLLRSEGYKIFGTAMEAERKYFDVNFCEKTAVIIGSEANGMLNSTFELCDEMVNIPIVGGAESLNAAIAGAILMYEALRQKS